MFRAQTVLVAAVSLFACMFVLPACHSSHADDGGPSCSNGTKDVGEEGVDCGGVCAAKCTGETCAIDKDCASGHCLGTTCGAPAGKPCGVGATPPVCADGEACELDKDCSSGYCDGKTCMEPAAGAHTDGIKNDGETGIDCGGSVKTTQPCPDGQGCGDNTDCVGTCTASVCGPIGPMDGKKDNGETDVDCGGPNAPGCDVGKVCGSNADCALDYCPDATKTCVAPTYSDGVQNGTETDVDCGGTGPGVKACPQGGICKVDTDCNGACAYTKKCVDMPSCKRQHGGDTCGGGDSGNGQTETHATAADPAAPGHEDCCRTLPVKGYTDPAQPGKTVYLDKYEITAGRMRAFLEAIGGGADPVLPAGSTNPKPADVKGYMATHRPSRWNAAWENVLPSGNTGSSASYTVKWSTTENMYPGQDYYMGETSQFPNMDHYPRTYIQNTWWIRATGPTDTAMQALGQSGNYTIDTSLFAMLNSTTLFPEFYANPANWPPPNEGQYYAEAHALNCSNAHGAYGWSTFWIDAASLQTSVDNGSIGKVYTEDQLDEKSMNCSPNALFAAFCAWDGGQLATAEVMDAITGNTVEPAYTAYSPPAGIQTGKLAAGYSTTCANNTLNTFSDGTQGCYNVYYYPSIDTALPVSARDFDDSGKIASPGRVAADAITMSTGDEPWTDLIGNLEEVVLKKGETARFDYRGFGLEYGSIVNHKLQQTTSRFRGGAFGARCMRFK